MTFLLWQISLFLFLAALLGCVIGWFLRGRIISSFNDSSEGDDSKVELSKCEKRVEELEKEIKRLENQLDDTNASSTPKKTTRTTSKSGSTKKATVKGSSTKASASTPDNLKEISGIGAVIEKALHEADITTFAQVAKLKTDEKELIAKNLENFADRIERDKWIEQAKALHKAKYGKNP